MTDKPIFLLAPGAGASCAHPRMQDFARLLAERGEVTLFDYPYQREGRRRPDPLPRLVEAHREAVVDLKRRSGRAPILVGKSMGGRVGCHVSLEEETRALVCLGYPLLGGGDPDKKRDAVLRALKTPILFVQGTRDPLCPLDLLAEVRAQMQAPSALHVAADGDHSLLARKTALKAAGATQADVDRAIGAALDAFIAGLPR
ncbi:MAG TPA: alpha/beta fold hydrolase [Beijerinckiaceae bacterium]|jgi:predicted alpha/beta-hydrolase family hydrolase